MRIGVLAQTAGTTARAVRHYHRLGLMPEPPRTPSGYREYSMNDLVRLMRIRWLAESGVPLGAISAMPTGGNAARDDVVDDLSELIAGIDREQKLLGSKKSRLQGLLADAKEGRPLSALPRPLADHLSNLIECSDPRARAELERERDHLEVLALSGKLPEELATAMTTALRDPESVSSYLAVLTRWSALAGVDPSSVSQEIEELADDLATLLDQAKLFSSYPLSSEIQTPVIDDVIPDSAQRGVVLRAVHILSERQSR